ncbi:MAG: hypothetical protein J3R72DRAFT_474661 [Linnemannia gamsii]|nr:MAG: hypothetical protein J3R72DRAFT_474661 [Linnemannia gamsii]
MVTTASLARVLSLPELTPLIAAHLTPPDLAACSRVSRLWNDAFTPSLWHTFDDRLYNWSRIVKDPDDGDSDSCYEEALDRARQVIQKYGHHIHHLSVESWVMTNVVAEIGRACGGAGLHLNSIWFDMSRNRRCGGGGAIVHGLVQHLYRGSYTVGIWGLEETYPRVRTLLINNLLTGEIFHNLLKYLPGLEDFGVSHLWRIEDHVNYEGDEWTEDLGRMLAKHCRLLEVFRNSEGYEPIPLNYWDKKTVVNEIEFLLENCPRLQVFVAIEHCIEADHTINRQPWLVGFRRQGDQNNNSYAEALQVMKIRGFGSLTPLQRLKLEKHQGCRTQQRHVYDRLATLVRLKTLGLGHEFFEPNIDIRPYNTPIQYSTHGDRRYMVSNGPIPKTIELSLESGLERLGNLEKLEMFGFGGVDHRIQEPELEWKCQGVATTPGHAWVT